jgi:cadmium resistance protein CadD (predicted permease)
MPGFIEVISVGIAAFVPTNIDDLFILMVFFSKRSFPPFQIMLGQYVGMGLLIGLSLVGSLVALIIPHNLIGLVGLFPIAIGIKELVESRRNREDKYDDQEIAKQLSRNRWTTTYLSFLTVATVTFSGGEEIGIFTSIFVTYDDLPQITTIVSVVMILTGVWCALAAYLVNRAFLATRFRRISETALPFVLIGLGIYILVETFLVPAVANVMMFKMHPDFSAVLGLEENLQVVG